MLALALPLGGFLPSPRLGPHLLAGAHELHEGSEELLQIPIFVLIIVIFRRSFRILLGIFIFILFFYMIVLSILFMTFNVELVNGDLEAVVDKIVQVQQEDREPAGREAACRRTETPATRRQMPRVGVRRRRERAR